MLEDKEPRQSSQELVHEQTEKSFVFGMARQSFEMRMPDLSTAARSEFFLWTPHKLEKVLSARAI